MTLGTVARQASPSMGFSRQEHWGGDPGVEPMPLTSPASAGRLAPSGATGETLTIPLAAAAAAAESLQPCLTLHGPMDCSPPGSSVHGIFQARVLEWGAIAFSATLASRYLS